MTAKCIMVQGTASNVGKSVLCTALARIFYQDGFSVAPFKAQNITAYSYVTRDGREIGLAQAVQAEAACLEARAEMNPILLKPNRDNTAQVIVRGRPFKDMGAREYQSEYIPQALVVVKDCLERLRAQYEIVVIEGAGSPVEINLKDRDIANMKVAQLAQAPVLLVADIERGGVFASIVGTLELLPPAEVDRVAGIVINKFGWDRDILQPGLEYLEQRTGKPVLGVLPYRPLEIDPEDSLALEGATPGANPTRRYGKARATELHRRQQAYDTLAALVRKHMDLEAVYGIMGVPKRSGKN